MVVAASILLCISPEKGYAQQEDSLWWNHSSAAAQSIEEVRVEVRRPLREIGLQQTLLDTTALREQLAASMADVLNFHSSLFVKQHGRGTLSTIAFRGTSASHTQVSWNGLQIQSPMLGQTDFSLIPSYLIDDARLLHGSSSVKETGGGLGGAVVLATRPTVEKGFDLRFIQGVGSYSTVDDFLHLTYASDRWQSSTRVVYAASQNDFHYTNLNKKEYHYNAAGEIVGSYHPVERNRNCDFSDLHLLQELYHQTRAGNRLSMAAWYLHSNRGVPMLNVDYNNERAFQNEQRERTLRSVVGWERLQPTHKVALRAGYTYSWQGYDLGKDLGNGAYTDLTRTRSHLHTLYARAEAARYLEQWLFSGSLTLHRHWVESRNELSGIGYDEGRGELSLAVAAQWQPTDRLGVNLTLREEWVGRHWSPLIPLLALDYRLTRRGELTLKGSLTRNHRYPTLNDLYYQPGGNRDLKEEQGFSYDLGVSFRLKKADRLLWNGSLTWFDSRIRDWILWRPTAQGFWTPENIAKVHAYGVEWKSDFWWQPAREWQLGAGMNLSWTPSINEGEPLNAYDQSVGKQLIYIPEYSASVNLWLGWRRWRVSYKGCYYSDRYTTSDNNRSRLGRVEGYYLSEGSLEKGFVWRPLSMNLKLNLKNLFDIDYESVLSRPMPGLHFEFFLEIRPHWGKKSTTHKS